MSLRIDVIRLAGDAGFSPLLTQVNMDALTRLVDLAQAVAQVAEREACAQLCVADESRHGLDMADDYLGQQAEGFAAAIRARKTTVA